LQRRFTALPSHCEPLLQAEPTGMLDDAPPPHVTDEPPPEPDEPQPLPDEQPPVPDEPPPVPEPVQYPAVQVNPESHIVLLQHA
jgi:hypothetical protein